LANAEAKASGQNRFVSNSARSADVSRSSTETPPCDTELQRDHPRIGDIDGPEVAGGGIHSARTPIEQLANVFAAHPTVGSSNDYGALSKGCHDIPPGG